MVNISYNVVVNTRTEHCFVGSFVACLFYRSNENKYKWHTVYTGI